VHVHTFIVETQDLMFPNILGALLYFAPEYNFQEL